MCVFVMLNPSTADAAVDDPTVSRCRTFARRAGANAMRIVNLYALRATNPNDLWTADDPVGPDNDSYLVAAVAEAQRTDGLCVAAWGAHARQDRVAAVAELLRREGAVLQCLGVTQAGAPRHPLYLPSASPLAPWPSRNSASLSTEIRCSTDAALRTENDRDENWP